MNHKQPPQPMPKISLFGAFFGASLGVGAAAGVTAYVGSVISGGDAAMSSYLATRGAVIASAMTALCTAGYYMAVAPIKANPEYTRRARAAVAGALLAVTECALVSIFSEVNFGEAPEQKIERTIAPPVIVQQNKDAESLILSRSILELCPAS